MADPKVVEYIKNNLNKGTGIEGIKSSLRQSGWPEDQISQGVAEVQGGVPKPGPAAEAPAPSTPQTKQPEGEKKGHKRLIVALIILLIILILFLYVAVNIVSDFREMFPGAGDMIPIDIPFIS